MWFLHNLNSPFHYFVNVLALFVVCVEQKKIRLYWHEQQMILVVVEVLLSATTNGVGETS